MRRQLQRAVLCFRFYGFAFFNVDAIGDHVTETYSSIDLVIRLCMLRAVSSHVFAPFDRGEYCDLYVAVCYSNCYVICIVVSVFRKSMFELFLCCRMWMKSVSLLLVSVYILCSYNLCKLCVS